MRFIGGMVMMGWLEGCRGGKGSGLWDGREFGVVAGSLLELCLWERTVGPWSRWNLNELPDRLLHTTVHSGSLDHCLDGPVGPSERRLRWQCQDG